MISIHTIHHLSGNTTNAFLLHLFLFFLSPFPLTALNTDGILLLSFKSSILSDSLSVLRTWNSFDATPCQWYGVTCSTLLQPNASSSSPLSTVTTLALPNTRLLGSISADLGLLQHLRHLDLSNNFLNGTLPDSLFNATELQTLSLSNNEISGPLPPLVGNLQALRSLNLSDNALDGKIPIPLATLPNLTILSLSNNYFSGSLPSGFEPLQVADLSSNLINGSLLLGFGGGCLRCLNLSYNRLSGGISPEFARQTPANASLDLSFNNLTGEIPETGAFLNQNPDSFAGNPDLCGKPLNNPCSIPSTLSTPPNVSTSTSPLAVAAIPKTLGSAGEGAGREARNVSRSETGGRLRTGAITGIVVGDLAGIGVVSMVFLYLYQTRKKRKGEKKTEADPKQRSDKEGNAESSPSSSPTMRFGMSCLMKKGGHSSNDEESSGMTGSEAEEKEEQHCTDLQQKKKGTLVSVDGESKLKLETLLKASAYVLGAKGTNILYKAVLDDGTTLAVRRIGESSVRSSRDLENQVRLVAKMRHQNLLRVRGFYWGDDEKLVIYDYAPHGSLASAFSKKQGSSPCHLSWDVRLRIARGVARGLLYLHEKKYVHGNLKPSNILLGADMEPRIGDFSIDKLASSDSTSNGTGGLAWHFGRKLFSHSRDNLQDVLPTGANPSVSAQYTSPYHAPDSLKNLKPNPKWDVYSFGIVLLELLSGKVFSDREISSSSSRSSSEWNMVSGENWVLKMVDVVFRDDMEGKEEALLAYFKLGFSCASVVPQKRPSMKEVVHSLDKIPSPSSSSSH